MDGSSSRKQKDVNFYSQTSSKSEGIFSDANLLKMFNREDSFRSGITEEKVHMDRGNVFDSKEDGERYVRYGEEVPVDNSPEHNAVAARFKSEMADVLYRRAMENKK